MGKLGMGMTLVCVGRQVASNPLFGDRPGAHHCSPRGPGGGGQGSSQAVAGGRTLGILGLLCAKFAENSSAVNNNA